MQFSKQFQVSSFKFRVSIPLTLLLLLTISCSNNRLDVDVSKIEIEPVKITRLEKEMFALDTNNIKKGTEELIKKYGNFYIHFVKGFINNAGFDSSYEYNIKGFISDKDMKETFADCEKAYPDLAYLEADLTDAFKHYKYHFPERKTPQVVSFMSGFNYSVLYMDSTSGIGLEMYLGERSRFYDMMGQEVLPMYRRRNMNQQNILPDCIRAWMSSEFKPKQEKTDLLSQIVQEGKNMYVTDALLTETDDTLKIGYTGKQLEWCKTNEYNMWAYFVEQKLLYSNDYTEIMKYTGDGPFTAAFNKESPSRVGNWIGWQIVRAYMNKNKEVSVAELMEENDAQKILQKSKYKPKK